MTEKSKPCTLAIRRRRFLLQSLGAAYGTSCEFQTRKVIAHTQSVSKSSEDVYVHYVRTSKDFQRVKQERIWSDKAFPGWIYMPWSYQWTIGYSDFSGKWSKSHGYNGAFLDGNSGAPDSPAGKLAWINRFGLHFYVDHTAGKGKLHLWDGGKEKVHLAELHGNGTRTEPVNEALNQKLREIMRSNINQVKSSPSRAAYALDDEVSWGHFSHPTMWNVTDDADAYPSWLQQIYGASAAPVRKRWVTYEDIRPHLAVWSVREFDASPLMDQWSFNDSIWCNLLGDLVEYSNQLDPQTPCGIVGGQAPGAFGGYDYAKLMRKIQYIEAYNIGSSQAIIRS